MNTKGLGHQVIQIFDKSVCVKNLILPRMVPGTIKIFFKEVMHVRHVRRTWDPQYFGKINSCCEPYQHTCVWDVTGVVAIVRIFKLQRVPFIKFEVHTLQEMRWECSFPWTRLTHRRLYKHINKECHSLKQKRQSQIRVVIV